MGLFGYNQKDYAKNTELFKSRIYDLMERSANQFGVGQVLNNAMLQLERLPYPQKGKGKDIENIDARINGILNIMMDDIQHKRFAYFSEHASMLISAVVDSRQYGKELYTPEELDAQEKMAQCKGEIFDALDKKGQLAAEKQKLVEKGKKLSGPTQQAEMAKLNMSFNLLSREEQTLDQTVAMFTKRHNSFVEIVNARKVGREVHKLQSAKLPSLKDFTKEMAEINKAIAIETQIDEDITETAKQGMAGINETLGGGAPANDAFYSIVAASKAQDASEAVDNAQVDSSSGMNPEFLKMLNKD